MNTRYTSLKYDATKHLLKYNKEASDQLGSHYWETITAIHIDLSSYQKGMYIVVPKGYLTDGISMIKTGNVRLIAHWANSVRGVIAHDYLCEYGEVRTYAGTRRITRAEVDKILYLIMKEEGVPFTERMVMYAAVVIYRKISKGKSRPNYTDKQVYERERNKALNSKDV